MKILFMGTPEFALNSLKTLDENHDVIGIFTKVDKPNTRGKKIKFNPIKQYGLDNDITVYQPNSVKTEETIELVKKLNPDLIVVVAYGKILPQGLIDIPKKGIINVHSSLLPKYRGAAPIHAAIINGEKESGVTIMDIVQELDAGDIILQAKTPIDEMDTLEDLHDRLAIIGSETLLKAVSLIESGVATRTSQDESKVTFVKPIKKEECEIHWDHSMEKIYNFVRGLNPFPSAYSFCNKKLYKVYFVEKYDRVYGGELGEVVDLVKGKGPIIKVLDGSLIITSVKPENKRKMTGSDLVNGNYIKIGEKFSIGRKAIQL
ncbi:MAG: methionyl-tRNA formyltransferase [Psychrilyobacter sp.]|uniref:methionyl-tRNA formyltransferase n=1 Tax=Psychrilyobacter sp. TaxID=2586924 RepID=UPI003C76B8B1